MKLSKSVFFLSFLNIKARTAPITDKAHAIYPIAIEYPGTSRDPKRDPLAIKIAVITTHSAKRTLAQTISLLPEELMTTPLSVIYVYMINLFDINVNQAPKPLELNVCP